MRSLLRERKFQVVLLLITAIMLVASFYSFAGLPQPAVVADTYDFIPLYPRGLSDCDQLFNGTPAANFSMSDDYRALLADFEMAVDRAEGNPKKREGFSAQMPNQILLLHYIAGKPFVRNVCETGFNLGHSSFNFLTANRHTIVHSFDLGSHKYARSMAEYMQSKFPGRFFIHFGDSTRTIPEFIRTHPDFRCDLMYVDGGHRYRIALSDLLNFAAIASDENIMVFDDYPSTTKLGVILAWAWEDMRRWGFVRETVRCSFKSSKHARGFVIGDVIQRPSSTAAVVA